MKHLRLYQTTQAMTADLANLETPYVAVAEDALDQPVIQKAVTQSNTRRVYIEQSTYNTFLSIDASDHIYFVDYEPEITVLDEPVNIPWLITASGAENYLAYFDVPEGTNITIKLPSEANSMFIYDITNGECISSSISIGDSDEGIAGTVGSNDLVLSSGSVS